ncbi:MAG TPA: winged helix-turn-helix domain-containing protein [Elusimicrobiota bacterium]|nr:winged helix-turn-helix domain-containing protein [Elusimicrobiota bacterium]
MTNEIGRVAGDVWRYLERNGETSALRLRSALKVSQSQLFLALGWLSREEKILLVTDEKGYRVSLKR